MAYCLLIIARDGEWSHKVSVWETFNRGNVDQSTWRFCGQCFGEEYVIRDLGEGVHISGTHPF